MRGLQETLLYESDDLLIKFQEFFEFSDEDVQLIFIELKKWLWIKALHTHLLRQHPEEESLRFHFHVLPSIRIIDEMWHIFILFTEEYSRFCREHFDCYVNHTPSLPHKRLPEQQYQIELQRELTFIGLHLGEDNLIFWMRTLKEKFPEALINSRYIYRKIADESVKI